MLATEVEYVDDTLTDADAPRKLKPAVKAVVALNSGLTPVTLVNP
jgi:hypothetical protein